MSEHASLEAHAPAHATPPAASQGRFSPYLATWIGLGGLALVYVSVAVAMPGLLATSEIQQLDLPQVSDNTDAAQANLQEKLARLEKDLNSTAGSDMTSTSKKSHLDRIAALEAKAQQAEAQAQATQQENTAPAGMEASEAKAKADKLDTVATTATQQAAHEIADRLGGAKILNNPKAELPNSTTVVKQAVQTAAVDQAKATATDVAARAAQSATKPAPVVAKTPVPAKPKASAPVKKAAVKPAAKPAPKKPKVAAKKPAAKPPIKTGSVGKAASQPIAFGPAVVTRTSRPIGVRIATGPSVDSLRLSWNAISDRYGPAVSQLQPRYVTGIGAGGLTYDLIAGPFNTQTEASQVCARMHANGARCALGEFTGNAL